MAPTSVQMVLVEGENADGVLVEEDGFGVTAIDDSDPTAMSDQVISAILGTREGAAEAGFELSSVGVTWTDQVQASVLRDALSAHRLENVMLVSAFLAATALAQSVGGAMGYECTAVLFVEPDTATLAIVETSDGSIVDIYKERIEAESYDDAIAQLTGMVYWLEEQDYPTGGVFVLGSGVDTAPIVPALASATSLQVNVAEEPATALARGAALASANAPLFASSTAALAYAQDPGTGAVDPYVVPEYVVNPLRRDESSDELAYSLVSDEDADAPTAVIDTADAFDSGDNQRRKPVLLVGSGLAVVAISAVVALEIALAIGIRTTVALQPSPNQSLIVPTQEAPAPPRVEASAPAQKLNLPAPIAAPRPPVLAALPAAPVPAAPPLPAAPPVPVPVAAPPILPVPVPVRLPVPAPVLRPPVIEAPPVLSPPQHLLPQPPLLHLPEPSSPPEGSGTIPHSPPHQLPPTEGLPPNPGQGVGHLPFPGSGGNHGGGPLGGGPFGGGPGGEPASPPPFGGGHGGGPLGGGILGGQPGTPPPLGGGHGGPLGGGILGGGGPFGGGGAPSAPPPFGGGGHPSAPAPPAGGGGPFGGGGLGGFGGGHAGGGLGGFGGGGHSGGGFGGFGGGGHSGGGFGGGGGGHH